MRRPPSSFLTITNVSQLIGERPHVLRHWEKQFPSIRPLKRGGGRRYYRRDDVSLLAGISTLLRKDGITIRGVQKILADKGAQEVIRVGERKLDGSDDPETPEDPFAGAQSLEIATDKDLAAMHSEELRSLAAALRAAAAQLRK